MAEGDGEGPDSWCKARGLDHAYQVSLLFFACLFGFTVERLAFKPLYPTPEDRNKMSGGQLDTADDLPQLQEENEEVFNEGGGEPAGCHGEDWNSQGDWQLNILDQEGVKAAGLGRGTEMIMSQIILFQEEVRERLGAIEAQLKKMEKGKGREGDADKEDTQHLDVEDKEEEAF